jgi:hypothetical protein
MGKMMKRIGHITRQVTTRMLNAFMEADAEKPKQYATSMSKILQSDATCKFAHNHQMVQ